MGDVLGIVVGSGKLPIVVAEEARRQGKAIFPLFLSDNDKDYFSPVSGASVTSLGIWGALEAAREAQVSQLVFAGGLKQQSLEGALEVAGNAKDKDSMGVLSNLTGYGDNALVVAIIEWLEKEYGFSILSVTDIIADIGSPAGLLGDIFPSGEKVWQDIMQGVRIVQTLGKLDIGQACVVRQGRTVAVEAMGGTNDMLRNAESLKISDEKKSGVMVKLLKPEQDRRIDLPTIGDETIKNAALAGLAGIAVEAGEVLILERSSVIKEANEKGLFIYGLSGDELRLS
ncbi:MAG: UDP-2,3-diacylglucosamine diphosphatase LpxI [Parvularculales bacterium]